MFEKDLRKILIQSYSRLEFVVVASCHSYNNGLIFKKAGAKHVVCVEKTKQLNDEAAILFA